LGRRKREEIDERFFREKGRKGNQECQANLQIKKKSTNLLTKALRT